MTTPHTPGEPYEPSVGPGHEAEPPTDRPEPAPATKEARPASGLDRKGRVKRTRASGLWVGLIGAAILSLLFLVFIVQNSEKVDIQFLGFDGRLSLAVALLLSAVIGVLVVAVPGAVRITQLRRALRKNAKG